MFDVKDQQSRNEFPESLETSIPASFAKDDAALPSSKETASQYFCTEIRDTNVGIVVLLCWFVTGSLDGTIFNGMTIDQHH